MKKKLLTLALLAWGLTYSTSALAETESTLVTVYSQDYEGVAATDWATGAGQLSLVTGDATYGSYTKLWANSSSGDRTAYWNAFSGDLTDGYIDADLTSAGYNIDMDIVLQQDNSARNQQFVVVTTSPSSISINSVWTGTDNLFSLSQNAASSTTWNINDLDNGGTTTATLESDTWYHLCLNVTTSGVTYTITNGSETIATGSNDETYDELPTFMGFVAMVGRTAYSTYAYQYYDNIKVTKYVEGVVANDPTITLSGINGASRTYTITCADGETIHYLLPGATEYVTGDATSIQVETSTSGTLSAYTTIGSATSNTVSATVEATELTLATPTITASSYASNAYTVTLASDQSGVTLNPAATIYYSIDGATAVAGTSVSVPEGSTITAYAVAEGYTNSGTATWTAVARPTTTIWTQDYRNLVSGGPYDLVLNTDADFSVNSTDFYNITGYGTDGSTLDVTTNVGVSTTNTPRIRYRDTSNNGLLFQSASTIGIQNLEVGQVIAITGTNIVPTANYGVTYEDGMSVTNEYYFTATDTEASIDISNGTYNYLYTITVLGEAATTESVTVDAAGYATYVTKNAVQTVDGVTLYAVTDGDEYVTLTAVEAAPAGTPLLIEAAAAGTYELTIIDEADAVTTALVAATEDVTCTGSEYVLAEGTEGVGFYKATEGTILAAGKCYISSASAAKVLRIINEATGVAEVEAVAETVADGAAYNLAGQKVNANAKGIVIINGKKYVNK